MSVRAFTFISAILRVFTALFLFISCHRQLWVRSDFAIKVAKKLVYKGGCIG